MKKKNSNTKKPVKTNTVTILDTPTIQVIDSVQTYNGTVKTASVSVTPPDATYTLQYRTTYDGAGTSAVNIGAYYVYATTTGAYSGASDYGSLMVVPSSYEENPIALATTSPISSYAGCYTDTPVSWSLTSNKDTNFWLDVYSQNSFSYPFITVNRTISSQVIPQWGFFDLSGALIEKTYFAPDTFEIVVYTKWEPYNVLYWDTGNWSYGLVWFDIINGDSGYFYDFNKTPLENLNEQGLSSYPPPSQPRVYLSAFLDISEYSVSCYFENEDPEPVVIAEYDIRAPYIDFDNPTASIYNQSDIYFQFVTGMGNITAINFTHLYVAMSGIYIAVSGTYGVNRASYVLPIEYYTSTAYETILDSACGENWIKYDNSITASELFSNEKDIQIAYIDYYNTVYKASAYYKDDYPANVKLIGTLRFDEDVNSMIYVSTNHYISGYSPTYCKITIDGTNDLNATNWVGIKVPFYMTLHNEEMDSRTNLHNLSSPHLVYWYPSAASGKEFELTFDGLSSSEYQFNEDTHVFVPYNTATGLGGFYSGWYEINSPASSTMLSATFEHLYSYYINVYNGHADRLSTVDYWQYETDNIGSYGRRFKYYVEDTENEEDKIEIKARKILYSNDPYKSVLLTVNDGLFLTEDKGKTYTSISGYYLPSACYDACITPDLSSMCVVGDGGLYLSNDYGATFTNIYSGNQYWVTNTTAYSTLGNLCDYAQAYLSFGNSASTVYWGTWPASGTYSAYGVNPAYNVKEVVLSSGNWVLKNENCIGYSHGIYNLITQCTRTSADDFYFIAIYDYGSPYVNYHIFKGRDGTYTQKTTAALDIYGADGRRLGGGSMLSEDVAMALDEINKKMYIGFGGNVFVVDDITQNVYEPRKLTTNDYSYPIIANTGIQVIANQDTGMAIGDLIIDGRSIELEVLPFEPPYPFRRFNESWDSRQQIHDYALSEHTYANTVFFDDFIGASVGGVERNTETETGFSEIEETNQELGKTTYEKTANFLNNHADIDSVNVNQLYSLAKAMDVPIDDYRLSFPAEIRRLIDVVSMQRAKLLGAGCGCDRNFIERRYCKRCGHSHALNRGTERYVPTNYFIQPDTPFVVEKYRSLLDNRFEIIWPESSLTAITLMSDLSSVGVLKNEDFDKYYVYDYVVGTCGTQVEGAINWFDEVMLEQDNALEQTDMSRYNWYKENGIIDKMINYELHRGLNSNEQ